MLDMSSEVDKQAPEAAEAAEQNYEERKQGPVNYESSDSEWESDDEEAVEDASTPVAEVFGLLSRVTGKTLLRRRTPIPVVQQLKEALVEKNVALEKPRKCAIGEV